MYGHPEVFSKVLETQNRSRPDFRRRVTFDPLFWSYGGHFSRFWGPKTAWWRITGVGPISTRFWSKMWHFPGKAAKSMPNALKTRDFDQNRWNQRNQCQMHWESGILAEKWQNPRGLVGNDQILVEIPILKLPEVYKPGPCGGSRGCFWGVFDLSPVRLISLVKNHQKTIKNTCFWRVFGQNHKKTLLSGPKPQKTPFRGVKTIRKPS